MFINIQSASTAATGGIEQADQYKKSQKAKLEFIHNINSQLPYKTGFQSFNIEEFFEIRTVDEQYKQLATVKAAVEFYEEKQRETFYKFDFDQDDAQAITFIPLSMIP